MDGQCHMSVMRSVPCVNAQQQQGTQPAPNEDSLTPLQGVRGPALRPGCLDSTPGTMSVSSVSWNEPTDMLVSAP